jgi:hypothetical protein
VNLLSSGISCLGVMALYWFWLPLARYSIVHVKPPMVDCFAHLGCTANQDELPVRVRMFQPGWDSLVLLRTYYHHQRMLAPNAHKGTLPAPSSTFPAATLRLLSHCVSCMWRGGSMTR